MRRGSVALIVGFVSCAGLARAEELAGRFGYLGEWDVSATLARSATAALSSKEYSGVVRLKHTALCAPGEASEKTGQIRISVRSGARYTAHLNLAGDECSFSGTLSDSAHTFISCGGQGQIPLRLWFK